MSTPFIQTDIKQALEALNTLSRKLADMRPVMASIANTMHESVMQNFAQQGRPSPWKTLAPATIAQRKKQGTWPGNILDRASQAGLKASISTEHDATSATVGTNKVYAAIHQFGGQAGRGRKISIPARPFLWLGPEELEELVEIAAFYLAKE